MSECMPKTRRLNLIMTTSILEKISLALSQGTETEARVRTSAKLCVAIRTKTGIAIGAGNHPAGPPAILNFPWAPSER